MKFGTNDLQISIDVVGFLISCHTFKIAAMMSFHAEKCYHLVCAHAASALHIYSCTHQFLIHTTFVLFVSVHGRNSLLNYWKWEWQFVSQYWAF